MSDAGNPFEAMMRMGQEWAKALNPALESFTPKGFEALIPTMPKAVMETFMGKTLNPDGLDEVFDEHIAKMETREVGSTLERRY